MRKEHNKDSNELKNSYFVYKVINKGKEQMFALNVLSIKEIIPKQRFFTVPGYPPFVEGIIYLRKEVITVVDTLAITSGEKLHDDNKKFVIIVENENGVFGLLISELVHIVEVNDSDVLPVPSFSDLTEKNDVSVSGIINFTDHEQKETLVSIVNLNGLLSRLVIND